jgi:uncharacterized protein (TIGR02594 family)
MRHGTRIILAISCISMLAASAPASSEPSVLVSEARKYMGTNPTDRKRLWCATFMNMVLAKAGYDGTHSDAAKSFAYYGRRISEPRVGAIAVLSRGRRGGHVGVVSGVDSHGNPIIISGNHNKRVGEAVYSRARVIAYVMPSERRAVTTQFAARGAPTTSSELAIDSPIAELIAAIRAESDRASAPQAPAGRRAARPAPQPAASNNDLPLDPLIADLLSRLKDDPKPAAQPARPVRPMPPQQRQQRVQQTAGRF